MFTTLHFCLPTWQVAVLPLAQRVAVDDLALDLLVVQHLQHLDADGTIGDEDDVAGLHTLGQLDVRQPDLGLTCSNNSHGLSRKNVLEQQTSVSEAAVQPQLASCLQAQVKVHRRSWFTQQQSWQHSDHMEQYGCSD